LRFDINIRRYDGHAQLERLYDYVARLPQATVVAEFSFGATFDDVRAAYFSARHGHPIVNGYSGELPASYRRRRDILSVPLDRPNIASSALASSGATCVVVHEWAFEGGAGRHDTTRPPDRPTLR